MLLACARYSHGIHHAWRGLVENLSHALRGFVVLIEVVVAVPVHG